MAPLRAPSKTSVNSQDNIFDHHPDKKFKYKYSDYESGAETDDEFKKVTEKSKKAIHTISPKTKITISWILTLLNLLNYIDRFTIISISESRLKCYFRKEKTETDEGFSLSDKDLGMVQSVFYVAYMLISPFVGYLGGKYSRKLIVSIGISIWCTALLMGSYITVDHELDTGADISKKWLFLLTSRSFFGMGEACYICLATAIIHDMFMKESERMNWLIIFSMAIPVGSGMGFILGAKVADFTDSWQWATCFNTPVTGAILAIWIFFVPDVPHGYSDMMLAVQDKTGQKEPEDFINQKHQRRRTYKASLSESKDNQALGLQESESLTAAEEKNLTNPNNENCRIPTPEDDDENGLIVDSDDSNPKAVLEEVEEINFLVSMKRLIKNKSYVYTTIGFTAVCWSMGAGTTFIPVLFQRSEKLKSAMNNELTVKAQNFTETDILKIETDKVLNQSVLDAGLVFDSSDAGSCGAGAGATGMMIFGVVSTISGLVGAYSGGTAALKWREKGNMSSETDVCALGVLFGAVFLYVCFICASMESYIYYTIFFIGLTSINLTWAVINKIILSVVHPYDKSLGSSMLNLISHMFGDVISPIMVGQFSTMIGNLIKTYDQFDDFNEDADQDPFVDFLKIQQALMVLPIVCAVGSLSFFTASLHYKAAINEVTAFQKKISAKMGRSSQRATEDEK